VERGELGECFSLMEVAGLLRHAVEQQLREEADLSYVQFQLLSGPQPETLAELLGPVRDHMRSWPPRSANSRRRSAGF